MNKTIYIRDEDEQVWDRARELAGDKLSPIIVAGLKKFIAEKDTEAELQKGFRRIELAYNDSDEHNLPKKKAFIGKWIFSPKKPLELQSEDGYTSYLYAIAQTAKGNFAFLTWIADQEGTGRYRFLVYQSLEQAAENSGLNYPARRAMEAIGVPVEELDI